VCDVSSVAEDSPASLSLSHTSGTVAALEHCSTRLPLSHAAATASLYRLVEWLLPPPHAPTAAASYWCGWASGYASASTRTSTPTFILRQKQSQNYLHCSALRVLPENNIGGRLSESVYCSRRRPMPRLARVILVCPLHMRSSFLLLLLHRIVVLLLLLRRKRSVRRITRCTGLF